jgi:hypothetical protein
MIEWHNRHLIFATILIWHKARLKKVSIILTGNGIESCLHNTPLLIEPDFVNCVVLFDKSCFVLFC